MNLATGSTASTAPRDRQRRVLLGLAVLFFAPLAAAFYLYYGQASWHPGHQVNRGDLINPPRPLPPLTLSRLEFNTGDAANPAHSPSTALTDAEFLHRKWTLLYVGDGACAMRCKVQLYNSRQVRIALDRDAERVQRVFIARGACCDVGFLHLQHPDLIVILDTPAAAPLWDRLPSYGGIAPAGADRLYIVDPLGNLMMSYAPDAKPKGLLEDMKRLLRLSSVG